MTEETAPEGMALGGVGAGGMVIGRDGVVRDVTTNNNRLDGERIPVARGAFLAVRAACGQRVETRLLQESAGAAFDRAEVDPPLLERSQTEWDRLFPGCSFTLKDDAFPLDLNWTYLTPVVPYDAEAATMPLVFVRMKLRNPGDGPCRVSGLVNWENLSGCAGEERPKDRGEVEPVRRGPQTGEPEPEGDEVAALAGLRFGHNGAPASNHEGSYALLASPLETSEVSVANWDLTSGRDTAAFWRRFAEHGRLWPTVQPYPSRHGVAVCQALDLAPGREATLVWALAWRFPRFASNGNDHGNWYAVNFADAVHAAWHGAKHHTYYFEAVEAWQRRVTDSTLPAWLARALVNCNASLTANTVVDRQSHFGVFDSPSEPVLSTLERRLPASLGPMLFLPEFSIIELRSLQHAAARQGDALPADLGLMTNRMPRQPEDETRALRLACEFVLTVYRDYRMTGKRTRFELLLPLAQRVMQRASGGDDDADGVPDSADAVTRGLWVAALRAYGRMAEETRKREEAGRASELLALALDTYEQSLNQPLEAEDEWLSPWMTEFLCLGALPWRRDPLDGPGADAGAMDYLSALARACMAIYRGDAQGGLKLAQAAAGRLAEGPPLETGAMRRELPALWHVLYALEGFWYDVPKETMWLRPNLPGGVNGLRAPLFTPLCLGELRFSVAPGSPYSQTIGLSFDSPLRVKTLIARVPKDVEGFCVACRSEEGMERTRHAIGGHGRERLIEVVFDRPLRVGDVFHLTIRENA